MGTRATYTFKGDGESHTVYVHWDGYPTGAAEYLGATLKSDNVWELPRYEADEFAAGFVATVKTGGGNVRLAKSPRKFGDIQYAYTVTQKDGELWIKAQSINNWDSWKAKTIWQGKLSEFIESGAESLE